MAQVILKKYLPQDIAVAAADAENYFSFFTVPQPLIGSGE